MDADTGTNILAQVSNTKYQALFFDYLITRTAGIGVRAGTVTGFAVSGDVEFTDVSTVSFGDTSGMTFEVAEGLGNFLLRFITDENNVKVKGLLRLI